NGRREKGDGSRETGRREMGNGSRETAVGSRRRNKEGRTTLRAPSPVCRLPSPVESRSHQVRDGGVADGVGGAVVVEVESRGESSARLVEAVAVHGGARPEG